MILLMRAIDDQIQLIYQQKWGEILKLSQILIMPVYWKWLYRERKAGESEYDKIMRKLSFKLPVVVRYNVIFAFFFGCLASFATKRVGVLYFYRFVPFTMAGLCYEEIIRLYRFYQGLEPLSKESFPSSQRSQIS